MESEFLSPAGKKELGALIVQFRERLRITNWAELAEVLSAKAGYPIGHDQVWKVAQGYVKRAPSIELIYALTLFPEFQTPDGVRLTVEMVAQILAGDLSVLAPEPGLGDTPNHEPD